MTCRLRQGFTLIELLVVIAIIAVLAGTIFPVFARAREKARQTRCTANLKQIGLAVEMYATDYDEAYPLVGYAGAGGTIIPGMVYWNEELLPYVRSDDLLVCPSHSRRRSDANCRWSYGWNYYLSGDCPGSFSDPSAVIISGDCHGISCAINYPSDPNPASAANEWPPDPRHNGMAVFLFADGHCKAMEPEATETPVSLWDR